MASALNDTTREFGAAFGIAAGGSILNAGYRSSFDASPAAHALPAQLAALARNGFGAAQVVAARVPHSGVARAAQSAIVHGLSVTMVAMAGFLTLCAVIVAVIAPRHVVTAAAVTAPMPEVSHAE